MEQRAAVWLGIAAASAIAIALALWFSIRHWTSSSRLQKAAKDSAAPKEGNLRDFTDEQWRDLINKRRAAKAQAHAGRSRFLMDNPPSTEGSPEGESNLRRALLHESASSDLDQAGGNHT
ncbi:hypothetical protein WJX72_003281 [[Myrmecia] bisecta]|uniref:Uncharacterized protein n=1 Tax=[Myrmecia] bisecta TaxID=41462 RepID=A0AAW1R5D4_9CHLO